MGAKGLGREVAVGRQGESFNDSICFKAKPVKDLCPMFSPVHGELGEGGDLFVPDYSASPEGCGTCPSQMHLCLIVHNLQCTQQSGNWLIHTELTKLHHIKCVCVCV